MLPDYPHMKKEVQDILMRYVKEGVFRRAPILRGIRRTAQHEGDKHPYTDVDGNENQIEYEEFATHVSITREELRHGTFQVVLSKYDEIAEAFAEAQSRMLFATVSEAAASVGNVVHANGPLTKETFLELLETVQRDFHPRTGEPQPLSMVLHPDTLARIEHDLKRWEEDPQFLSSLSRIEQRQRLAWRDRESRRRLVD